MNHQIERKPLTKKTNRTRNSRQNTRVSARLKARGKARPASEGDEIVAEGKDRGCPHQGDSPPSARLRSCSPALWSVTNTLRRNFGVTSSSTPRVLPAPWVREILKPASVSSGLKVVLGAIRKIAPMCCVTLNVLTHVDRYEQCTWHLDFHDHFTARPDAD
jgi:hypothetical protein